MDHRTNPQGVFIMSSDRIDALSRSLADPTSRRSLLKILGVGVAGTAVTVAGLNEALAKSNKNKGPFENKLTNLPVRGKGKKGTFKGTLDINEFKEENGKIVALGTVKGKLTGKDIRDKKVNNEKVKVPVSITGEVQAQAVCEILNLVLGPIRLDLLGLHLRTNTIRIRLFATPDGLLGSLLCGLSGPIDLSNLAVLIGLLNDILCELTGGAVCP
jgi:hypothetical protein